MESAFFAKEGEYGLTSTSAAHLSALASNFVENQNTVLRGLSFLNEKTALLATETYHPTAKGMTEEELNSLTENIKKVSEINGFIAWFAEARKYLDSLKSKVQKTSVNEFCEMEGIKYPEVPDKPDMEEEPTYDDMLKNLSIKDRQVYLALEAKAATIGKLIHKKEFSVGYYAQAREDLMKAIQKPSVFTKDGRDSIITVRQPSLPLEQVEKLYLQLQAEYRETEQNLNHMKAELRDKLASEISLTNDRNMEAMRLYNREVDNVYATRKEINLRLAQYKQNKLQELAKIRFAVPDRYKETVKFLNSLGKKQS